MGRCIRIGALGVVNKERRALAADLLHAVCETRKTPQTILQCLAADAERKRCSGRAGGVLRIMQSAQ